MFHYSNIRVNLDYMNQGRNPDLFPIVKNHITFKHSERTLDHLEQVIVYGMARPVPLATGKKIMEALEGTHPRAVKLSPHLTKEAIRAKLEK